MENSVTVRRDADNAGAEHSPTRTFHRIRISFDTGQRAISQAHPLIEKRVPVKDFVPFKSPIV
jgi:hypothetical protein